MEHVLVPLALTNEILKDAYKDENGKLGYFRAYLDNYGWTGTTYFPYNEELKTPERKAEMEAVGNELLNRKDLDGLDALMKFCLEHPTAADKEVWTDGDNYHFSIDGELCKYWVRFICRPKDYNLYLHIYVKESSN